MNKLSNNFQFINNNCEIINSFNNTRDVLIIDNKEYYNYAEYLAVKESENIKKLQEEKEKLYLEREAKCKTYLKQTIQLNKKKEVIKNNIINKNKQLKINQAEYNKKIKNKIINRNKASKDFKSIVVNNTSISCNISNIKEKESFNLDNSVNSNCLTNANTNNKHFIKNYKYGMYCIEEETEPKPNDYLSNYNSNLTSENNEIKYNNNNNDYCNINLEVIDSTINLKNEMKEKMLSIIYNAKHMLNKNDKLSSFNKCSFNNKEEYNIFKNNYEEENISKELKHIAKTTINNNKKTLNNNNSDTNYSKIIKTGIDCIKDFRKRGVIIPSEDSDEDVPREYNINKNNLSNIKEEKKVNAFKSELEKRRYVKALKNLMIEKFAEQKIVIPNICSCGQLQKKLDTLLEKGNISVLSIVNIECANNCIYYNNDKEYKKALSDIIASVKNLKFDSFVK